MDVEVTQEDIEVADRAILIWADACGGPTVATIAAALSRSAEIIRLSGNLQKTQNALLKEQPMASDAREVAEGITVRPDVMGGQACIAGTRIPPGCVKSLARAGYSVTRIRYEYPTLSDRQVADALAWMMRPVAVRAELERKP